MLAPLVEYKADSREAQARHDAEVQADPGRSRRTPQTAKRKNLGQNEPRLKREPQWLEPKAQDCFVRSLIIFYFVEFWTVR